MELFKEDQRKKCKDRVFGIFHYISWCTSRGAFTRKCNLPFFLWYLLTIEGFHEFSNPEDKGLRFFWFNP